jgi:hypothetical protein
MVSRLIRGLQNIFFWAHARNTWQWDVLCVLILTFIFLTPKSWLETDELQPRVRHQSLMSSTLLISPEVIANEEDKVQIEGRIRAMTGRPNVQVVEVRKKVDRDGKILGYEVDIR